MNFLNPLMLFGLGAAALPVLIHLFSRRRAKDVQYPSIEFLERMKTDRMRRLRFRQMLALLLRTLAVVAVVLAFARPAVRSSFRESARTSAVVMIDASASMRYVDNGELLFDAARRKAQEILALFGEGDRTAVVLSGKEPIVFGTGPVTDGKALLRDIQSSQASFGSADPTSAFRSALEQLRSAPAPNRELYYLTDGAANAFPESLAQAPQLERSSSWGPRASDGVRLYVVLLGPAERGGAVIESVELRDRLLAPGREAAFLVTGSVGPGEESADVEFFVNGQRTGRKEAVKTGSHPNLIKAQVGDSGGGRFETEFRYTFEVPGFYSVKSSVPDGRYEPGETRRMVVRVPEKKRILLCGGSPADLYFLVKALRTGAGDSARAVKTMTTGELTAGDLDAADTIVLSGVRSLPHALYRKLLSAVADRGAGLVVFPPAEADPSLYAEGIFSDIFPATVDKRVTLDAKEGNSAGVAPNHVLHDSGTPSAFIDRFDLGHPILANLSRDGRFQRPTVRSYLRMVPRSAVSVAARFSDGSVAIGSAACGRGKAVVFGIAASLDSGDFPLTGLFVPIFIRSVQYVSGIEPLGGRYETGEPIRERVGTLMPGEQVIVKPEHGPARAADVTIEANGALMKEPGGVENMPGFCSVLVAPQLEQSSSRGPRVGAEERARFSVDIPVSELRFARAPYRRMAEAFSGIHWKSLKGSDNLAEVIRRDRYGMDLYGVFLLLAGLLLAVEMAVSRRA
jgi:hypothetical protein